MKKAKTTARKPAAKKKAGKRRNIYQAAAARRKNPTFKTTAEARAWRAERRANAKKWSADKKAAKNPAPSLEARLDIATGGMVKPKGFAERPVNTRWPGELKIGKRHRKEYGDIEALALSFNERGAIIQPIAITTDDTLIAGERRLKAWRHLKCKFRDQPIPVHVITIDSIVAGEWDENAHRKDFTFSEAVAIKKEIDGLLKKYAKDRQRQHGGTAPGRKAEKTSDAFRAGERAAAMTGKKRRTLEKAEQVVEAAEQDPARFGKLRDDMDRTGKVDGPFRRLQVIKQTEEIRKAPPPLPMKGPYEVASIDFPWPHEGEADQDEIDEKGRSLRPYPAMSIKAGCKFMSEQVAPLLAKRCTVYFWVTNHHLVRGYALHLLQALGFREASTMGTWVKDKMGRGQILRDKTEHCIIATRGKPLINLTNQTTDWSGPGWERRENSRKPEAFYRLVEELTPASRYAEIFSTGGVGEKWDCHGDQAGRHAPAIARAAEGELLEEAAGGAELQHVPEDLAEWRALGLVEGPGRGAGLDAATIALLIARGLVLKVPDSIPLYDLTEKGRARFDELEAKFANTTGDPVYDALLAIGAGRDTDLTPDMRAMLIRLKLVSGKKKLRLSKIGQDRLEEIRKTRAAARVTETDGGDDGETVATSEYQAEMGFPLKGGFRTTPDGQPKVPDIVKPGMIVTTNSETGPYRVVSVSEPEIYKPKKKGPRFEHYSLELCAADAKPRKKDGVYKVTGWIKELVAVDGRLLHLFEANTDEVLIQPEARGKTDPALIEAAVRLGHTISMTLDGDDSVGTCQCGHVERFPRQQHQAMDAAIEAHWSAVVASAAPPVDPPAENGEDQLGIPGSLRCSEAAE